MVLYFGNQAKVPERIVSLLAHVRPIIRGKEAKPVEFGAKVNMLCGWYRLHLNILVGDNQ